MKKEAMEVLLTRRSVRKYQTRQVPEEILDAVLQAGLYAPTARGAQETVLVAVQEKALRDQLSAMNAKVKAGGANADPYYGAPVIILVLADTERGFWVQDGSCALCNMLNAAHAHGLGSCWINRVTEMFDTPEGKALLKQWGLPETLRGVGSVALGYAEGEAPEAAPRKEGRVVRIL